MISLSRLVTFAAHATLLALLLPGRGDCFAPSGITRSVIRGEAPSTLAGSITTKPNDAVAGTTHRPTRLKQWNNDDGDIGGSDRALSCLPYLLPLLDGERYGRYLFYTIPALGYADYFLLGPFRALYGSIPFSQFAAFIALSVLSRNPALSRPVRFNMQQALLLDIALIFPSLLGGMGGAVQLPAVLANSGSNFVYLALAGSVGYSLVSNLTGKVPNKIPIVSEAADSSIGW